MGLLILLFAFFSTVYALWVIAMGIIWLRRKKNDFVAKEETGMSIIIPFRNESMNLGKLISNLERQEHAGIKTEFIFVNDHSEDDSLEKIKTTLPHQIIQLDQSWGKKSALAEGITLARFPWIITIDADVSFPDNWLSTIHSVISQESADMYILPLMIDSGNNLFGRLQSLEFMSVLGTTGAMAMSNQAIMCNGANLVFRKSAWEDASRTRKDSDISSGDDMFLLQALRKKGIVRWLHSTHVIAATAPCESLNELISQRVRWASKSGSYQDIKATFFALVVFMVNFSMVLLAIASVAQFSYLHIFLISLLVKLLVDSALIIPVLKWTSKMWLIRYYPLLSILYPFYVTSIVIIGFFIRPKWKGRTISLRRSN